MFVAKRKALSEDETETHVPDDAAEADALVTDWQALIKEMSATTWKLEVEMRHVCETWVCHRRFGDRESKIKSQGDSTKSMRSTGRRPPRSSGRTVQIFVKVDNSKTVEIPFIFSTVFICFSLFSLTRITRSAMDSEW